MSNKSHFDDLGIGKFQNKITSELVRAFSPGAVTSNSNFNNTIILISDSLEIK